MSSQPKRFMTEQEYLQFERNSPIKHEYWGGEVFAMSGARRAHNVIASNTNRALGNELEEKPCEVYPSDMRVRTPNGLYTYPDLTVVCGEPEFVDDEFDTLLNPVLIVEILSRSTETYDRTEKLKQYRAIPSVTQYLMISSLRPLVELHTRQPDGGWAHQAAYSMEDSLELSSCGCSLKLADIYRKVKFAQPGPFVRAVYPDQD